MVQLDDGGGPSLVRLKLSRMPVVGKLTGPALGEADDEGEVEALGERLGLVLLEGLALEEGESDGDPDDEGLTEGEGETDALPLLLGETEADGEGVGLTLGEPTDDTLRISTIPPTLADAVLRVKEPLLIVPIASKV